LFGFGATGLVQQSSRKRPHSTALSREGKLMNEADYLFRSQSKKNLAKVMVS
jgi:hypothetical protein